MRLPRSVPSSPPSHPFSSLSSLPPSLSRTLPGMLAPALTRQSALESTSARHTHVKLHDGPGNTQPCCGAQKRS